MPNHTSTEQFLCKRTRTKGKEVRKIKTFRTDCFINHLWINFIFHHHPSCTDRFIKQQMQNTVPLLKMWMISYLKAKCFWVDSLMHLISYPWQ